MQIFECVDISIPNPCVVHGWVVLIWVVFFSLEGYIALFWVFTCQKMNFFCLNWATWLGRDFLWNKFPPQNSNISHYLLAINFEEKSKSSPTVLYNFWGVAVVLKTCRNLYLWSLNLLSGYIWLFFPFQ